MAERRRSVGCLAGALAIAVGCGARSELHVGAPPAVDAGVLDADADAALDTREPADVGGDLGGEAPPTDRCPLAPPTATAACPNPGAVCAYRRGKVGPCSDADARDQVVYRCEGDGWLEVARCIDPSACPPSAPAEGAPCEEHGLDCFYSNATCAPASIVQCESGRWTAVNDCGARARSGPCVPTPTLVGDARILLDGAGTIADHATVVAAGTQLLASWLVTPELGGAVTVARGVVQTAVPSMAAPLPFVFFGPDPGDVPPAVDFARDRFAVAWGSRSAPSFGAWTSAPPLDGAAPSTRIDPRPADQVDVATRSVGDATVGWLVERYLVGDATSASETAAIPLGAEGLARGPAQRLADDRDHGAGVGKLHHLWTAAARWGAGFVLVSSVGPAGDLWDDTGVLVWFIADPTATTLPPPVRFPIGQTLDGDVTATADGSVILVTMPETAPARAPYELRALHPDATSVTLPGLDLGVAIAPRPARLAPFEAGFAVAFAAETAATPDFVPGLITVALRDAHGEPIVDPIVEPAIDLRGHDPVGLAFAPTDRALDVTWATDGPGGRVRVMRQRFVCRGSAPTD